VERNGIAINKLATFRVQETATLKVANYLSNSDLRATPADYLQDVGHFCNFESN
jgi:hypothetical protein